VLQQQTHLVIRKEMLEELGKDTKKYTTTMSLHTLNHILVYIPFQVCQDIALLTLPKDHHHAA
jgi:hypothetical protein